jgi:hypothetical protein
MRHCQNPPRIAPQNGYVYLEYRPVLWLPCCRFWDRKVIKRNSLNAIAQWPIVCIYMIFRGMQGPAGEFKATEKTFATNRKSYKKHFRNKSGGNACLGYFGIKAFAPA